MPRWALAAAGLLGLVLLGIFVRIAVGPNPGGGGPGGSATPSAGTGQVQSPGVGDTTSGGQGQDVDGIKCETHEQVAYHVHAHLAILLDGHPEPVSAQIGIPPDPTGLPRCFYWLHTHDTSGVIHIESPTQRIYTLGQFFDIWGQPLSRNGVATYPVPDGNLVTYVDGQPFDGDPRDVVLNAHTQVVLELGAPAPPPIFTFPEGL